MSLILPHTGLVVPDHAPRVVDLTTTGRQIEAEVADDHGILGRITNAPEGLIAGTGLAYVPSHPGAVQAMDRFMRATERLNDGPSVSGPVLLSLLVDEYVWEREVARAHRDEQYLVRYVSTELTWQTWHLTPDWGIDFPDYSACRGLLLENPLGWAYDVLEAQMWGGDEDWWVIVHPIEPPQE